MAYVLERQKTGSTPYIYIDEEKKYIKFEGECFHENVVEFFKEVSAWLEHYLCGDFHRLTFDCELQYFNSSTAKLLFNMLLDMDEHAAGNNQVTVNWITTKGNDIILECGEDFRDELQNLEFNFIIRE